MSEIRRAYNIARGYVNREWDRIQGVEREAAERELDDAMNGPYADPGTPVRVSRESERANARRVLGLGESPSTAEIQTAYDRLMERSDPARFPENSSERAQCEEIRLKVRKAFAALTQEMDGTERRFRTLEL